MTEYYQTDQECTTGGNKGTLYELYSTSEVKERLSTYILSNSWKQKQGGSMVLWNLILILII